MQAMARRPMSELEKELQVLIELAVEEDLGARGDVTVQLSIPEELRGSATIVARKPGVVAGAWMVLPILKAYPRGEEVQVQLHGEEEAMRVAGKSEPIATFTGPVRTILSAERVLLNFLGHVSGIATATQEYVALVAAAVPEVEKRPAVCDTRKTTPGYRWLDKYAVAAGGGVNHRMGLWDGVMLKDNHLAALREKLGAGMTLAQLTARMRKELDPGITLWLEVDTLGQLREALPGGGADVILLDNFTPAQMREAVALRDAEAKAVKLEASGGITKETIGEIARTGIDRISIGALTHSAPVLDLSMDWTTR